MTLMFSWLNNVVVDLQSLLESDVKMYILISPSYDFCNVSKYFTKKLPVHIDFGEFSIYLDK